MAKSNRAKSLNIVRMFSARPQLFAAGLVGLTVALLVPGETIPRVVTRAIIGFDIGAWLYIVLAVATMLRATKEQIQVRAQRQDEGSFTIMVLVIVAAAASLAAIVSELAGVKELHGAQRYALIGLALATIVTSWTFTHLMFAVHYAHNFYVARASSLPGGLDFASTSGPNYADFLYFSFTIGTSAQTADVAVSSSPMRKIVLIHSVLAFFFNATLLALTINIAAGLL